MPLQAGIVEKCDQRGTAVGSVTAKIEPTGQEELHKPANPACFSTRDQSNQLSSLSWQYALLLPCGCGGPHLRPEA